MEQRKGNSSSRCRLSRRERDDRSHNRDRFHKEAASSAMFSSNPSPPIPKSIEFNEKRDQNSPDLPAIVGSCPDMCPVKERLQRERLRDLSVFERLNGDPKRTSPSLAVKKFCRTISTADVQSSDIRPIQVLQDTLDYLLKLMDSTNHSFEVVHDFIFDRTRSIRQDLTMQNIVNLQAARLYEDMVTFHIISHQKLSQCHNKTDVHSLSYLNLEQLMKCLLSLYDMYNFIRKENSTISNNESEFYSFYVLLHLGHDIPKMGGSLSLWYSQLAYPIHLAKEMCIAKTILRYYQLGNFKKMFSLIANEATVLQMYLIEPFLNKVRARAIMYINNSNYKLQPYPLIHLSKILMIQELELESLCTECHLETRTDETGSKFLPCKQESFCLPKSGFKSVGISNDWQS